MRSLIIVEITQLRTVKAHVSSVLSLLSTIWSALVYYFNHLPIRWRCRNMSGMEGRSRRGLESK